MKGAYAMVWVVILTEEQMRHRVGGAVGGPHNCDVGEASQQHILAQLCSEQVLVERCRR